MSETLKSSKNLPINEKREKYCPYINLPCMGTMCLAYKQLDINGYCRILGIEFKIVE